MQLDCPSLEGLFTQLASDDAFRAQLLEHPHETFAELGIEVSADVTPEDLKLPPKEHFQQLLALMQSPGFDATGFVAAAGRESAAQGVFAPAQQAGIFGAAQQEGVFAASQQEGVFAASQQEGVFAASQQEGVFAASQQEGVFAASQQEGVFAASQQEGVFAAAQQTGIFAASPVDV